MKRIKKILKKNKKNKINKIEEKTDKLDEIHKNNKYLICDDSETNRYVLKRYLLRNKCSIDEANNGVECIELVEANGKYCIIWLDIQMPKMNGYECVKELRNRGYDGIIIGLTGYIDSISVNKALESGMNDVLGKPINKKILFMLVDKYSLILNLESE